jgi:hypothetical protein
MARSNAATAPSKALKYATGYLPETRLPHFTQEGHSCAFALTVRLSWAGLTILT